MHWGKARFGAYVTALESLGLNYDRRRVVNIDFAELNDYRLSWDRYCEQAEQLTKEGVTAWISVTEPAGWRLHSWMVKHNYRVPEDVSITGFHRPDDSHYSERPLTSITASYEAIGAAALHRLLNRIQNPAECRRTVLFPCTFYEGRTTAAPASGNP